MKLHLGQIGDYLLFVQVGIKDPILSNLNSRVTFLSFSQKKLLVSQSKYKTQFKSHSRLVLPLKKIITIENTYVMSYSDL